MSASLHSFHRSFGSTDIKISPLGLGTVKIGRNQGVKYPSSFQIPNDEQVKSLLEQSKALGINLIDTAPAYGNSEQRLGSLLKKENRSDWVIVSKFGEKFVNGISQFDFSAQNARNSLEQSLQNLKTDFIDIFLIHSDGRDIDILEDSYLIEELITLKKEGKIRSFGLSGKTLAGAMLSLKLGDCAMLTYNLNTQEEQPALDYAQQYKKGILIKKALDSGHLCRQKTNDPIRANFELIFNQPAAGSIVIGTINPMHLQANVNTAIEVLNKIKC